MLMAERQGHPHDGRLRLCAAGRLHAALELVPDILEVGRRRGRPHLHASICARATNGRTAQPFTAEDFRYWCEDVANNEELSPSGLPRELLVDGEPPTFEVLDETTVRYSWSQPNPLFLPALAGPDPLYIYRPAHYLKQFHAKYADEKTLADAGQAGQAAQLGGAAQQAGQHVPQRQSGPAVARAVDAARPGRRPTASSSSAIPITTASMPPGRQLPYIDRVVMAIADSKIIPAKTGAGESDLQARYLRFDNYTFLKDGEKRNDYTVAAVAHRRPAASSRSIPTSTSTIRSGASCARRALPPRAVARDRPARDQPGDLFRARRSRGRTRCCRNRRSTSRSTATPGRVYDLKAGEPPARRDRPDQARQRRHPPAARRPAAGDHRREFRRVRPSSPTCSS